MHALFCCLNTLNTTIMVMRWSSFVCSLVECMTATAGCGLVLNKQRVRLRSLLPAVRVLEVVIFLLTLMHYFGVQIHYNQWRWRICVDVRWLICWMYGTAIVLARTTRTGHRTFVFVVIAVCALVLEGVISLLVFHAVWGHSFTLMRHFAVQILSTNVSSCWPWTNSVYVCIAACALGLEDAIVIGVSHVVCMKSRNLVTMYLALMRYFGVQINYNQWRWRLGVDVRWMICWMYGTAIMLACST